MTPRERVCRAIEFRRPDKLPIRYSSDPERSDYIGLKLTPPRGWQPPARDGQQTHYTDGHRAPSLMQATTVGVDEWGSVWQEHELTSLGQVKGVPIRQWSDLETYTFPDPFAPGRFDEALPVIERYQDRYLVGSIGLMGYNRLLFLRGFEDLMMDLLAEPERAARLADGVFSFMKGIASGWAERGAQAVGFGDDLGSEQGTLMSPALFRSFFKPRYADFCAHCHALGLHAVLHSCGNVWDIIPDLIEAGFDVLNLEQPNVFGLQRLGETYGGKVCFLTNPDSQTTIPLKSPAEVAEETRQVVRALATEKGGLIANADCTWNHGYTPQENLAAMAQAFEEMRRRPYGAW